MPELGPARAGGHRQRRSDFNWRQEAEPPQQWSSDNIQYSSTGPDMIYVIYMEIFRGNILTVIDSYIDYIQGVPKKTGISVQGSL